MEAGSVGESRISLFLKYYLIDEHGVVWVTVLDFADHVEIGDTRLDHQHVSTLSHIPGKVEM